MALALPPRPLPGRSSPPRRQSPPRSPERPEPRVKASPVKSTRSPARSTRSAAAEKSSPGASSRLLENKADIEKRRAETARKQQRDKEDRVLKRLEMRIRNRLKHFEDELDR